MGWDLWQWTEWGRQRRDLEVDWKEVLGSVSPISPTFSSHPCYSSKSTVLEGLPLRGDSVHFQDTQKSTTWLQTPRTTNFHKGILKAWGLLHPQARASHPTPRALPPEPPGRLASAIRTHSAVLLDPPPDIHSPNQAPPGQRCPSVPPSFLC